MTATSPEVARVLRTIFRRCIECENVALSCPSCPTGQICSITTKTCDTCPGAICIADPSASSNNAANKKSGPNVGAIAGGVVGGIAFIVLATWLVWKFCIKRRQQEMDDAAAWDQTNLPPEKRNTQFTMRRDARMSTHTVHSLASTVLTRASNIIQIAYIPGITNRSGPQSPQLLVPPVPPIPIIVSNSSQPSSPYSQQHEDSHYFMPGDLRSVRGSTYTGYTDVSDNRSSFHTINTIVNDNRSSFHTMHSRQSITPSLARSSVATTIYRNDAVVDPMPATTVLRGKAAVINVKSGSPLATPAPGTPQAPSAEFGSIQRPAQTRTPSSPSLTAGNPPPSSSSVSEARPVPVTISKKKPSLISMNSSSSLLSISPISTPRPNTLNSAVSISESDDEQSSIRRSLVDDGRASPGLADIPGDLPVSTHSPFADMSATILSPRTHQQQSGSRRAAALDPVTETDETRRESSQIGRSRSPFGDEHECP
ncbi:hypothetical protein EJ05DRAFT_214309 [Pseudovirgaria hyperparasitica]|uniref:Membrane anchor Opy2 N-terminal domain-containing protein n=1 Tax=Pseudovirgaria hyperparasitica TaxID=470096 RepID=A0A6A6VW01_9PEZI|nr:uncharacterized protein EJ05DRAFT_214309 [Pseudovirgaria hyperparasitica]KAF2753421.1 hypothetical protein EJ05DRAFT_214309 [Pseudovirgaria hyperparasitica]